MSVDIISLHPCANLFLFFFFFNDTATTEIYTLSLHDALPISAGSQASSSPSMVVLLLGTIRPTLSGTGDDIDRKSTRLNSSHGYISYAVFCLKKKKKTNLYTTLVTHRAGSSAISVINRHLHAT